MLLYENFFKFLFHLFSVTIVLQKLQIVVHVFVYFFCPTEWLTDIEANVIFYSDLYSTLTTKHTTMYINYKTYNK